MGRNADCATSAWALPSRLRRTDYNEQKDAAFADVPPHRWLPAHRMNSRDRAWHSLGPAPSRGRWDGSVMFAPLKFHQSLRDRTLPGETAEPRRGIGGITRAG